MFKWLRIKRFIRGMRKKHQRYDFMIASSSEEIIIYVKGTEDQLRLKW